MKRFFYTILSVVLAFSMTASLAGCSGNEEKTDDTTTADSYEETPAEKAGNVIYVSVDGKEDGDGSKENPFATITAARDAIRAKRSESGLPDGGITVLIGEGTYRITEPIELTAEDSGEAGKIITYKAEKDAEVIIDGGVVLRGEDFTPANEEFKSKLWNEDAKANVVQIDLKAAGCYDFTPYQTYGWGGMLIRNGAQELFVDGERQYLAQWPDHGEYAISEFTLQEEGTQEIADKGAYYKHYMTIPEGKAELWVDEEMVCCGLLFNGWETAHNSAVWTGVDTERGEFYFFGTKLIYSPTNGRPYYLINLASELSAPGEFWRDPETEILYYYPDGDLTGKEIVFSQVSDYLVHTTDTSYFTFDGITFKHGRGAGIAADRSEGSTELLTDITVKNCEFVALGAFGVSVRNAVNVTVTGNYLHELGTAGIEVHNENYAIRKPSNNIITNNVVHDWAQSYPTENFGIDARGVGFYIAHNELYNSTHSAITALVSDSIIEYNICHDLCKMSGDAGAIYNGGSWARTGNVLRYNYIYNVSFEFENALRPNGLYLDDQLPGQLVYGNTIKNVSGNGIALSGGKNMTVKNNVLIDIGINAIGMNDNGISFQTGHKGYFSEIIAMDYTSEYISTLYPELSLIIETENTSGDIDDPGSASYTVIEGNILVGESGIEYDPVDLDQIEVRPYTHYTVDDVIIAGGLTYLYGSLRNNLVYDVTPGFTTIGKVPDALTENSQVYRDIIDFGKIPYESIGVIK
ncbi:MAG: right-handed parallel beta-helix repeat-containing protein [Clostridia bacterium]|nr:right-handed parallel beta-helix repeat-containing protein [Clostridia bacterium]